MVEAHWIESVEEFQKISKKWDDAILSQNEPNPFLLSNFILTWWQHYQKGVHFKIFLIFEKEHLVGGIPLFLDSKERLFYPGGITANYTNPFFDATKNNFWDIFLNVLSRDKNWSSCHLRRHSRDANFKESNQLIIQKYVSDYTYLIEFQKGESEFQVPKKLQYYIRRGQREFQNKGVLEFISGISEEEFPFIYENYVSLCNRVFLDKSQKSEFENRQYKLYFFDLLNSFLKRNWLGMNILKFNQEVVAIHFGYDVGKTLGYVLTTYDPTYAKWNPGHLLLFNLCELARKKNKWAVDLYTGGHYYKRQWSNCVRPVWQVDLYPKCFKNYFYANWRKFLSSDTTKSKIKNAYNKILGF